MKIAIILASVILFSQIAFAKKYMGDDLATGQAYGYLCIVPAMLKECKKYIPANREKYSRYLEIWNNKSKSKEKSITISMSIFVGRD